MCAVLVHDHRSRQCVPFPSVDELACVATGQEFAKSRGLHLFGIRSLTQRTDALLQDNAPAMVPHGLGHPPSRKRVVHL